MSAESIGSVLPRVSKKPTGPQSCCAHNIAHPRESRSEGDSRWTHRAARSVKVLGFVCVDHIDLEDALAINIGRFARAWPGNHNSCLSRFLRRARLFALWQQMESGARNSTGPKHTLGTAFAAYRGGAGPFPDKRAFRAYAATDIERKEAATNNLLRSGAPQSTT